MYVKEASEWWEKEQQQIQSPQGQPLITSGQTGQGNKSSIYYNSSEGQMKQSDHQKLTMKSFILVLYRVSHLGWFRVTQTKPIQKQGSLAS